MGFFLDAFEFLFTGGCLMALNFVFMLLWAAIQNLPALLRVARLAVREILVLSYRLYKPLIGQLQPAAKGYLGIDIGTMPLRILITGLLSLLGMLGLDLLLRWRLSAFLSILAFLHGAVVALLWDEFDHSDGIQTGERIP